MAFRAGAVSLAEPRRRQTLPNHKKIMLFLNILGRHSGSDGGAASLLPAAGAAFRAGTISVAKPRSFHAQADAADSNRVIFVNILGRRSGSEGGAASCAASPLWHSVRERSL